MNETVRLTEFSHGGGCGCKIAPAKLEEILQGSISHNTEKLLVGNSSKDDAAVYDMGNGSALISTTDFFMPIVDDPFDFGRIASANAISDVYAMGGKPLMALAVLGWPVEKLDASIARLVLEGARKACAEAGIPLAGGHSIDTTEPIFGLAVSGMVEISNLKRNDTAKEGDMLFLTKGIGTGILATALKRSLIHPDHKNSLTNSLTALNNIGEKLGTIAGVNAMTDVTGFGLLGHLVEMCEGASLSAELYYDRIKVLDGAREYLTQRIIPDATYRNWNSYSTKVGFEKGVNVMEAFNLLPDPQTNGGLLVSVTESAVKEVEDLFRVNNLGDYLQPVGRMKAKGEKVINVLP